MNSSNPVLTPDAIASAAGKKTVKVQRKLRAAESELRTANTVLRKAGPRTGHRDIDEALAESTAAEQKVREATDELDVVTELLGTAAQASPEDGDTEDPQRQGRSGQGSRSLMPHLSRK